MLDASSSVSCQLTEPPPWNLWLSPLKGPPEYFPAFGSHSAFSSQQITYYSKSSREGWGIHVCVKMVQTVTWLCPWCGECPICFAGLVLHLLICRSANSDHPRRSMTHRLWTASGHCWKNWNSNRGKTTPQKTWRRRTLISGDSKSSFSQPLTLSLLSSKSTFSQPSKEKMLK